MPPFHYPRFHIFKTSDGWHLWWIPTSGCIKIIATKATFEEALTNIDLLRHREPS